MLKRLAAACTLVLAGLLIIAGCDALNQPSEPRQRTELITVEIIITATTDPDATPNVIVVTATPDRTQVAIPDDIVPAEATDEAGNPRSVAQAESTADPDAATSADAEATDDLAAQLPEGCIVHTVAEGEAPFLIAEQYEADPFLLLSVNGLTEETSLQLQIGDELIVPLDDCPVEQLPNFSALEEATPEVTAEVTEEITEEATPELSPTPSATPTPEISPTPSVTPTVTLAPTSENAQVEIVSVLSPGDVTAEGVRIRNNGSMVDVTGWTLTDVDGNEYTFPDQLIFSSSELTVYTRVGEDTPVARFWGEDEAIWQPGDVVTLRDEAGDVQASYRIEQAVDLD